MKNKKLKCYTCGLLEFEEKYIRYRKSNIFLNCKCCQNELKQRKCKICNEIKSLDLFQTENSWDCIICENKKRQQKRLENRDKYNEDRRKYIRQNPIKALLAHARSRAKKENLPFELKEEDIVIPEFCPILKIKLENGEKRHINNSPTLDRIIPELGYIKKNCRVISYRANCIKNSGTAEEHENIAKYIRENSLTNNNKNINIEI